MKTELGDYILSLQSVFAIIADRLYHAKAPRGATYPFVVFSRISSELPQRSNAGLAGAVNETYQIDCYAKTDAEAEQLKEAIRRGLDGYSGTMGAFTVYSTRLEATNDLADYDSKGKQTTNNRIQMDFNINRSEAVEDRTLTTTTTT